MAHLHSRRRSPLHAPQDNSSPGTPPEEIRVEDLHKAFGEHRVLCGVNLSVRQGELVAIVGGSGCGKTVLLEHMIGHFAPDRGRVLIADHDTPGTPLTDINRLEGEDLDRIRMNWAVVFQRNALFSGTVLDNIALWLREIRRLRDAEIRSIAESALKQVGFTSPDEVLLKDRDDLSGGMAKRVAIARALAMDPIIMFYDEPTTGLDPNHARQIHELIQSTHDSPGRDGVPRTTLIITHDKDLLYRLQPRVVMLHEGTVYFDGGYEQFQQSDSPIIQPYFDLMPGLQRRTVVE